MKKLLYPIYLILAVTLIIAVCPTEEEGAIYKDTLRLHILANSNSKEDQSIKLCVRDMLLEKYSNNEDIILKPSANEASKDALIREIEFSVNDYLKEINCPYTSKVSIDTEWFNTREYADFTLPCGNYEAIIVDLGSAEGENWWCVMYPPLCLEIASTKNDCIEYSKEEKMLINGYSLKFKMLELIAEAFSQKK